MTLQLQLQPGDILAYKVDPQASLVDRFIGWGEHVAGEKTVNGYNYYHVALVSEDTTKMYSSQPLHIDLYPVPNPLPDHIEVYRYSRPLEPVALARVFSYAESRRGKLYPIAGVLSFGWLSGNLEFCSQYLEDSWFAYPLELSGDVRFTTPDAVVAGCLGAGFSLVK